MTAAQWRQQQAQKAAAPPEDPQVPWDDFAWYVGSKLRPDAGNFRRPDPY